MITGRHIIGLKATGEASLPQNNLTLYTKYKLRKVKMAAVKILREMLMDLGRNLWIYQITAKIRIRPHMEVNRPFNLSPRRQNWKNLS